MSIIENAQLRAKPGHEDAMSEALPAALTILEAAENCLEAAALRCIERPDEFRLVIRWTDVQSHLDFRDAPAFADYRATFSEHLDEVTGFAHYRELERDA
jgi:quinol monooxygenase YgiN